jgi:lysozyme
MVNRRPYRIKAGDTLSAIAQRELGKASNWRFIAKQNGDSFTEEEARQLAIGLVIYLPIVDSPNHSELNSVGMRASDRCLKFIADHEGIFLNLYNDPANHATIGIGHLVHLGPINGSEIEEFKKGITKERAFEILREDVKKAEEAVNKLVKVPLNQNQFDALVSFVFNLGSENFASSTLLKKLNGGFYEAVPDELLRWVYAGGQKFAGLVNRRRNEGNLFNANG